MATDTWYRGDSRLAGYTISTTYGPAIVQKVALVDGDGNAPSGAFAQQVQGNVASGVADSGNPLKMGGLYSTAPATLTNGQRGDLAISRNGSVFVDLTGTAGATAAADATNNNSYVGVNTGTLGSRGHIGIFPLCFQWKRMGPG